MAFDYDAPAELYMPKRKSIGRRAARRPVIVASRRPPRLFALQLRNFLPSRHLALGCRWEINATTPMKFADYTKAAGIRCTETRVKGNLIRVSVNGEILCHA
jgi:hypothetical protein